MMLSSLKLIMVIFLFSILANALAATVQSLTLPLSFKYESNPLLSSTDKKPVSRVIFVPNYSVISNQGSSQWFASTSVSLEYSSDQKISKDRSDPSINLGWMHDFETGQFGVTALLNNQSTRVSEFTDSGLVIDDNTIKTRSISVSWLNNLSDRTSLTLGGVATNTEFDGPVTVGLVDYRNETINAKLGYTLSEKIETFMQYSFSNYEPKDTNSISSKTKSIDLGIAWNISEKFNMGASAGVNETTSGNTNNKSWQGSISTQYITLRTNSHLSLSRSLLPSSIGGFNESNQFAVGWIYSLSERDNIALDFSWRQNLTINKYETKQFTANYTRELGLSWDFRMSAEYRTIDNELTNVDSSSIMATIIYKLPDF